MASSPARFHFLQFLRRRLAVVVFITAYPNNICAGGDELRLTPSPNLSAAESRGGLEAWAATIRASPTAVGVAFGHIAFGIGQTRHVA